MGEMKGIVKNLEDKMSDGFRTQEIHRKKDYDDLEDTKIKRFRK